jgi:type II secretory pathway pseudopilin PulG
MLYLHRKQFRNNGFTLVEMLVYVALMTLLLSSIIPFLINMSSARAKHFAQVDLYSQARFVSEKIKREIRNAKTFDQGTTFDVNLAQNSGYLKLLTDSSPQTFLILEVQNGVLRISRDSGTTFEPLTSAPVTVADLTFHNYTDTYYNPAYSENIGFTLTLVENAAASKTYLKETFTVTGAASIRSSSN